MKQFKAPAGFETFSTWSQKFERSNSGKTALKALEGIYEKNSLTLQKSLKHQVLLACYQSFLFWHVGDINSEKRDLLRDIANLNDPLHDKIKDIIHEIAFFSSVHDILVREGAREIGVNDTSQFITVNELICHLELYKMGIDRLQDDVSTYDTRDECWVHGNMRYPERIDSKDQHGARKASTCLMFQLAIFFRLWTHPKGQKLFDKKLKIAIPAKGIAMPKDGQRHDKIITAFINATFANQTMARTMSNGDNHLLDEIVLAKSVSSRLEKIDKDILLIPWTDASFDVMTISKKDAEHMRSALTRKFD